MLPPPCPQTTPGLAGGRRRRQGPIDIRSLPVNTSPTPPAHDFVIGSPVINIHIDGGGTARLLHTLAFGCDSQAVGPELNAPGL